MPLPEANSSFLADRTVQSPARAPQMTDSLLSAGATEAFRNHVESVQREREVRQHWGLTDQHTAMDQSYMEGMEKWLRENVYGTIKDEKRKDAWLRARAILKDVPFLYKPVPMAVIGVLTLTCTDEELSVSLSEKTRLSARTNLIEQRGRYSIFTPVVDTRLEWNAKANPADEKVNLAVSRAIDPLGVSGSLVYGWTHNVFTAAVSKQLTPQVSAAVEVIRPGAGTSTAIPNEVVRANYCLSF